MQKGERYDALWRWRRGGNVRPIQSDDPVEPVVEPPQRDVLEILLRWTMPMRSLRLLAVI